MCVCVCVRMSSTVVSRRLNIVVVRQSKLKLCHTRLGISHPLSSCESLVVADVIVVLVIIVMKPC